MTDQPTGALDRRDLLKAGGFAAATAALFGLEQAARAASPVSINPIASAAPPSSSRLSMPCASPRAPDVAVIGSPFC